MLAYDAKEIVKPDYRRMIRVDLAGERGACAIYAGQFLALALWPQRPHRQELTSILEDMAYQETGHVLLFEALQKKHTAPSTRMDPLWITMGWGLGVLTGWSSKATMTCTAAIEEIIETHYTKQIHELPEGDPLREDLMVCQIQEAAHKEKARLEGGDIKGFLGTSIRNITKIAIWLSERI